MLTRHEAFKLIEHLDDEGLSCTLAMTVGHGESREYEVAVNLNGLESERLGDVRKVLMRIGPDGVRGVVDQYGHLVVR